eukprot:363208-Chlamydomonas_euryale.AAC.8
MPDALTAVLERPRLAKTTLIHDGQFTYGLNASMTGIIAARRGVLRPRHGPVGGSGCPSK